mgnify:FL=1
MPYIHFSTSGSDCAATRNQTAEDRIRHAIFDAAPAWVSEASSWQGEAPRWIVVTHRMHDRTIFMAYDTRRHFSAQASSPDRLAQKIRQNYSDPDNLSHDAGEDEKDFIPRQCVIRSLESAIHRPKRRRYAPDESTDA